MAATPRGGRRPSEASHATSSNYPSNPQGKKPGPYQQALEADLAGENGWDQMPTSTMVGNDTTSGNGGLVDSPRAGTRSSVHGGGTAKYPEFQDNKNLSEIEQLRNENDMLREIETQFWALLNEREELKEELETMRSNVQIPVPGRGGGKAGGKESNTTSNSGPTSNDSRVRELEAENAKMREESDQLHSALEECMELLMLKDRTESIVGDSSPSRASASANILLQQHGPVASFLAWLALETDRANVRNALDGVLDSSKPGGGSSAGEKVGLQSPSTMKASGGGNHSRVGSQSPSRRGGTTGSAGTNALSSEERQAMRTELQLCKKEIRELQEELDRTDMSRLQALDDAGRLQKQIEVLSTNVTELRSAYAQVKARADKSVEDGKTINQLKAQLADSVAECNEVKAQLAQAKQMSLVGASSLAADAARIRGELMQRERSNSRSNEGSVGAPPLAPNSTGTSNSVGGGGLRSLSSQ